MTQAYPLHWPPAWPRTQRKGSSQFRSSLTAALNNVQDSLRRFASDSGRKISEVTISSNFALSDQRPADSGVAVYFTWDGLPTCIAVDRYEKIEDNLQAIHHCIEAERTKLRHGGLNLVRAAFRGYAALPPPTVGAKPWTQVLDLPRTASRDDIDAAYRAKAKAAHPDAGGTQEAMAELNQARADALREVAG